MKYPVPLAALAVTATLVLAACGSSGSSGTSGSSGSSSGNAGVYGSTAPSAPTAPASGAGQVHTRSSSLGTILVDGSGRSLYLWEADHGSTSMCSGGCAQVWPPLTTKGAPKAGPGVQASLLGTTKRTDGTREITYAGHPLYTFSGDSGPGQTSGQGSNGFGALWWVVSPAGKALKG